MTAAQQTASATRPVLRRVGSEPILSLRNVTVGYGKALVQECLSFDVRQGSIFAIMGGSGAGKSTVLATLVGLTEPLSGTMTYAGRDYWALPADERARIGRRFGVLFQTGALWSSLTVGENVALPMQMFTHLDQHAIRRLVELRLALVDLEHAVDLMPAQLSGGMAKRAGLARALALDPEVLFLDEPSAGLDPVASKRLDELVVDLRDALGATVVMVSHHLPSLLTVADDGIFLDALTRTVIARGSPSDLRDRSEDPQVQAFMRGAETESPEPHMDTKRCEAHVLQR